MERQKSVDQRDFREVLGRFASGVTVVAALDGEAPVGFACQSFASLSLDPPLVVLGVGRSSTSWPRIARVGRFCVNILAESQRSLCAQLGARGGDKFAGVAWSATEAGTVVLDGALATLDCRVEEIHEAGDHHLVTARVHRLDARGDGRPLLFYRSAFTTTEREGSP
jgi:3-hydroxy-9,10-secoandrosta-1,3,5(10)-triene-9,17-dione monooxygenase reductase component